jgi:uncharacterized protein YqhQ
MCSVLEEEKSYIPKLLYKIPIIRGFVMFLDITVFSKLLKALEMSFPENKCPKGE